MQSKTLSSDSARPEKARKAVHTGGLVNLALFRKNLARFWPLWAAYGAFWIIAVPVLQYMQLYGQDARLSTPSAAQRAAAAAQLLRAGASLSVIIGVAAGCLFAMALFSYLYSARSVGMMHSFPIRRKSLFLTNYLSGAAVFLATDAVVVLLTAAIQGSAGALDWGNLGAFFLSNGGTMLFFYSFAVFCAMFTGHILALPAFYAIFNVLIVGLNQLFQSFAGAFIYGYNPGNSTWVSWLTPAWKLYRALRLNQTNRGTIAHFRMQGLSTVGIYAAAGIVFAASALLVYQHRRSETAGDTVSVRCMRPVFRWSVALCTAFGLGQALYFLVFRNGSDSNHASLPEMMLCMIFCGLLGYYAAEMLLKKTFRVFRNSWRGAVILTALLLAVGIGTERDVLGVASRIPAASRVASVNFSFSGENQCSGAVSDAGLIQEFREAQKSILAEKGVMLQREKVYNAHGTDRYSYAGVIICYNLKNGATISRNYGLYYTMSDLKHSGGAISRLAKLAAEPEVQKSNLLAHLALDQVRNGEMDYLKTADSQGTVSFDRDTAREIYAAAARDIAAGHFGKNQFDYQSYRRETYANTLRLYYKNAQGELVPQSISFSSNCTELIAALKKNSITDAKHPLVKISKAEALSTTP